MADGEEFERLTEPFRRELLAHCYRMLGSVDDAEDLVQETYLRAWRSYGAFEGRSSVRTWLYRIATNGCLTALERSGRRVLPSGLGGPEPDPQAAPEPAGPGVRWLQPIPDALVAPDGADPAAVVAAREGLRLPLIPSPQYPPGTPPAGRVLPGLLAVPPPEGAGDHRRDGAAGGGGVPRRRRGRAPRVGRGRARRHGHRHQPHRLLRRHRPGSPVRLPRDLARRPAQLANSASREPRSPWATFP